MVYSDGDEEDLNLRSCKTWVCSRASEAGIPSNVKELCVLKASEAMHANEEHENGNDTDNEEDNFDYSTLNDQFNGDSFQQFV